MYDRIAVPLDGSPRSYTAIEPARRLAVEHGATVVLVSVATDGVAEAETVLAEGRHRAGSEVDVFVIEHTDPAVALGDYDASDPRTLLCMSTRGRGAVRRALIGRTALSVVEHSPHAVVLIGPRYEHQGDAPISPVIVCLDGTAEAEHVLPWVATWSERTGAAILLLRVMYPTAVPGGGSPPSEEFRQDLRYLGGVKDQLLADHPSIRHVNVPHERPDEAIRDASRGYDNAMLAVASSHPGTVTELLLGSTAAAVIRNAHVPVLVVSKSGMSPPA